MQESGGVTTLEELPDTGATTASAAYIQSINTAGSGLVSIFGTIDLTNGGLCAQPLLAAAKENERWAPACAAGIEAPLSLASLVDVVTAALDRWAAAGASDAELAAMRAITFEIAPLPRGTLGALDGSRVRVSRDADGRGWFVDATPGDDAEFARDTSGRLRAAAGGAAAYGVDLLTLIAHELAHAAGLDDRLGAEDVTHVAFGQLAPGARRAPSDGTSRP